MNIFWLLVKLRLKAVGQTVFASGKRGAKPAGSGRKILYVLLAVYIVGALFFSVGMMFTMIAGPLIAMGQGWIVMAAAALLSVALCFIGSVFITQQQLFEAKDNELQLSLPIKPGLILGSRMLLIVVINLGFGVLVYLPAFIVYCMNVPAVTAAIIVCFIIASFLSALFSTALSCICGWLIALISSKLRRKNLFTTVFLLIFFLGYMYIYMNLQRYATKLIDAGAAFGDALMKAFPPVALFGHAAGEGDFLSLCLFALWCLLPFVIVYYILSKTFLRIATARRGGARVKYRERELAVSSARTALLKKELSRFFSLPMYIFNCGIGSVFSLILAVALVIKGRELIDIFGSVPSLYSSAPLLLCAMLSFIALMNDITAPSVSLEGRSIWILKSAPVRASDVFTAKIGAALVVSLPPLLLASAVGAVVLSVSPADGLLIILLPAAVQVFTAVFGLTLNLKLPRFDWLNETSVVKNSASVMITVFGGMGLMILLTVLYWFLNGFLALSVSSTLYMAACTAFFVLASGILIRYLSIRGTKLLAQL